MHDLRTLYTEISTLIDEVERVPAPSRADVERTLTDGYAHAHALEARRWRLERRIGELALDADADARRKTAELADLAAGVERATGELETLRGLLATLRDRAAAAAA